MERSCGGGNEAEPAKPTRIFWAGRNVNRDDKAPCLITGWAREIRQGDPMRHVTSPDARLARLRGSATGPARLVPIILFH